MFKHTLVHISHKAHEPAHLVYLAMVGWEAHGLYGIAALVCLGIGVLSLLGEH